MPRFSPFAASLIAFQWGFLLSEHPLQNKTVRDTVPVEEDAQCISLFSRLVVFYHIVTILDSTGLENG